MSVLRFSAFSLPRMTLQKIVLTHSIVVPLFACGASARSVSTSRESSAWYGFKNIGFGVKSHGIEAWRETSVVAGSLDTLPKVRAEEITWDVNPFKQTPEWTISAIITMFESSGLSSRFGINNQSLHSFVSTLQSHYNPVPYHNWNHAFSVTLLAWMMVESPDIKARLSDVGRLSVLVAALCHDLDHPGVGNDFLTKAAHPLALQHGAPVLEQHHLRLAKQLLETEVQAEEKAECEASAEKTQYGSSEGILHGLALSEREELASNVEHAILGTDMSKHNLHVAEVEKWSEHQPTTHELIGAVVHAADLGGVGMVEGAAHLFSQGILREFHTQFVLENLHGVAPHEGFANLQNVSAQARLQRGFITAIMLPLWTPLVAAFPSLERVLERATARGAEVDGEELEAWAGKVEGLVAGTPTRVRDPEERSAGIDKQTAHSMSSDSGEKRAHT